MSLKNSSTNLAQAQMKALTKKNFHPSPHPLPNGGGSTSPNTRTIWQPKEWKRKKSFPESTSAPHNKQPSQELSLCPDHQILNLPLHLLFSEPPRTHHCNKNIDHLQSFTKAGKTLRRTQPYSQLIGMKMNSKKRNSDLKPVITARLKTLNRKF